jgi:hypothetical protein
VTIRHNLAVYKSTQDPQFSPQRRFRESIRLSLLPGIDFHIFDNIRSLGAPKGEESKVEDMIGALQGAVEIGERAFPIRSPTDLWDLFDIFNPMARQYGLDDCLVNRAHTQIRGS